MFKWSEIKFELINYVEIYKKLVIISFPKIYIIFNLMPIPKHFLGKQRFKNTFIQNQFHQME